MEIKPPTYLSTKRAKQIFSDTLAMLSEDSEKSVDVDMIASYAYWTYEFEQLAKFIRKNGRTITDKNKQVRARPETRIIRTAADQQRHYAKALGLDRYTRMKAAGASGKNKEDKSDPIGKLMVRTRKAG